VSRLLRSLRAARGADTVSYFVGIAGDLQFFIGGNDIHVHRRRNGMYRPFVPPYRGQILFLIHRNPEGFKAGKAQAPDRRVILPDAARENDSIRSAEGGTIRPIYFFSL